MAVACWHNRNVVRWAAFLPLLLLLSVPAGCGWRRQRLLDAREAYYQGNLDKSLDLLEQVENSQQHLAEVAKLDRALVLLAHGRPEQAEQLLRESRDRLDHLAQASVAEAAVTMVTDDAQSAFAGEPYERVLVRNLLTLSNLMHDGGDALAYALQAEAQQPLETVPGPAAPAALVAARLSDNSPADTPTDTPASEPTTVGEQVPVPLASYLHGMLREEMGHHADDAARCYERVAAWQPGFAAGRQDLQRVREGRHAAPGHGVLYVFALVGQGPTKQETVETPSTAALVIAEQIVRASGATQVPITLIPVKVPKLVRFPAETRAIDVRIAPSGGQGESLGGQTEVVTDIGQIAATQFAAEYDQVVARALARRLIKKSLVVAGKDAMNVPGGSVANLALDVGSVAWEALERADCRNWDLLPDTIQVCRLELPAGDHAVRLVPLFLRGGVGKPREVAVRIVQGRNSYALVNVPRTEIIGEVLTR